ncbi:MAG: enhanced serine sensitivity protein SseB C-terminal domain-containing protein [Pirellulales bacterium]
MFLAENDLERSLMSATADPSHRPQFYRDLLIADVYFVQAGEGSLDIQHGVLQEGSDIQIPSLKRDGEDWLPVFSSLARLQQSLQKEAMYLRLNAKDFFEITRGANVVLNPGLDYGKEFTAAEIAGILDGSIFRAGQGYVVEEDTQVLIGQPTTYPIALVNTLSRLFAKQPSVKAAYLAHFFNPITDGFPHTLIGIVVESDWDSIVGDAGVVAREVMGEHEIVDFVRVSPDERGLSEYMLRENKPFYKRSFLRKLFG